MLNTKSLLLTTDFPPITRSAIQTVQVNLGYLCNLSCTHCHVNAGPNRTELMDRETIDTILEFTDRRNIQYLDLTGGAPELNPHFRYLVKAARARGISVIDRCNLTVLFEPGQEDLADFLAEQQLNVTASLPCYSEQNVSEQRGKGVFTDSIKALQLLNSLGYGIDPALELNLVYNPNGAFLPPPQQQLELDYKNRLKQEYGIDFNHLLTITNMPISRFGGMLMARGLYEQYMRLLKNNYSSVNLDNLMCKSLISIDWQGYVFDCDFNQMLDMPLFYRNGLTPGRLIANDKKRWHISELLDIDLSEQTIQIGDHCYGCTAGQGSSCSGALD